MTFLQELDEYAEAWAKRRPSVVLCPADREALIELWRNSQRRPDDAVGLVEAEVSDEFAIGLREMFGDRVDEWLKNAPIIVDLYVTAEEDTDNESF